MESAGPLSWHPSESILDLSIENVDFYQFFFVFCVSSSPDERYRYGIVLPNKYVIKFYEIRCENEVPTEEKRRDIKSRVVVSEYR